MTINPDHPKIYGQMAKIMAEITAIAKDKKNQSQGFNYRGIDDVYNALNPLLAKHGVFMTARVIDKVRDERTNAKGTVLAFTCLRIEYTFWADDGSSVSTEVEGEGMDSGDKSSNKAMAVGHKYALLQAFCIPTQGIDDPDAEVHEAAPAHRTVQASTKKAAPATKEEPPHVKDTKAIIASAESITDADEYAAFFDGCGPRFEAIKEASENTHAYLIKKLGEIEAALRIAA
jgi:hypothetical protein